MIKRRDAIFECDFCGHIEQSFNRPDNFAMVYIRAERSGFVWSQSVDCCRNCLPNEFFKDQPKKIEAPKSLFRRAISLLKGSRPDYAQPF